MESAGLAVGVVALASLANDCINLLSLICAIRNASRKMRILETQLDIQKTLFLQWIQRVHLLDESKVEALLNEETRQSVVKTLTLLRSLLGEATTIEDRYGLRPLQRKNDDAVAAISLAQTICEKPMKRFLRDVREKFRALKISTQDRARWIIHDEVAFAALIEHITCFIDGLNKMIPVEKSDHRQLLQDGLSQDLPTETLLLVVDAAESRKDIVDTAEESLRAKCYSRILDLFDYPERTSRGRKIEAAFEETFEWVFKKDEANMKWDDFASWLKSESGGIYWVQGKAGSGKSTLMKFLWSDPRTRRLASQWAGADVFFMANFYFWRLGSSNQNTLVGLLRAILFEFLLFRPDLTQRLLPRLWENAYGQDNKKLELPCLDEFKEMSLEIRAACFQGVKMLFLIDGLDEFTGDYSDAVQFLQALGARDDTKVVISSRPEPAFVFSFDQCPRLRLEELTRCDIRHYTTTKMTEHLGKHPLCRRVKVIESSHCSMAYNPDDDTSMVSGSLLDTESDVDDQSMFEPEKLIMEIVEKAQGVFLWVVLACRSVFEGVLHYDDLDGLRQRIRELPPELDDMFSHMLKKVAKRYRPYTSKILRLCQLSKSKGQNVPLPTTALAIVDQAQLDPVKLGDNLPLSCRNLRKICLTLEGRLRSRSGGLVEITYYAPAGDKTRCYCAKGREHDPLVDSTVDFMHRTVFDFLNNDQVWESDILGFGNGSFDPLVTLAAVLACAHGHSVRQDLSHIGMCINLLSQSTSDSEVGLTAVMAQMEQGFERRRSDGTTSAIFADLTQVVNTSEELVTWLGVEAGLTGYVRQKLGSSSSLFRGATWRVHLVRWATLRQLLNQLPSTNWCSSSDRAPMVEWLSSFFGCFTTEGHAVVETDVATTTFLEAERSRMLREGPTPDNKRLIELYWKRPLIFMDDRFREWCRGLQEGEAAWGATTGRSSEVVMGNLTEQPLPECVRNRLKRKRNGGDE